MWIETKQKQRKENEYREMSMRMEQVWINKSDGDTPSSVRMPYRIRHKAFQFGPPLTQA